MRIAYKPPHALPSAKMLATVARAAGCRESEVLDLLRLGHESVRLPHPFGSWALQIAPYLWRAA